MRFVITGALGQLGRALQAALAPHELLLLDLSFDKSGPPGNFAECDILDYPRLVQLVRDFQPEVVIHSAAYTNVDGCARNPDVAFRINGLGTRNVALACQMVNCPLVYISTNEVFDGHATESYLEFDRPNPGNAYARSKLAGEQFVRDLLTRFYIVRTAWLYGAGGHNFVTKMIQLADAQGHLQVVQDEIGSPTYAADLAHAMGQLLVTGMYGVYHLVNAGVASRYEFAVEILKQTGRAHIPIKPITLAEFHRASPPPPFAPLRNFTGAELGITLRPWQTALADYIKQHIAP
jgi:dTDP-4-dehydrorhamnose reductase